jgi:hypothetical protein
MHTNAEQHEDAPRRCSPAQCAGHRWAVLFKSPHEYLIGVHRCSSVVKNGSSREPRARPQINTDQDGKPMLDHLYTDYGNNGAVAAAKLPQSFTYPSLSAIIRAIRGKKPIGIRVSSRPFAVQKR